jgi:hypothetical protein
MQSSPKSSWQSFQNDWLKTAAWAQQQGIKQNQFMPIYNQDAQKLLQSGSSMSQSERFRAVLAGAGKGLTALPQDNPNPTDIYGNVLRNAEQIFTGLVNPKNPLGLRTLFDSVANAAEHPGAQLMNPFADIMRLNTIDIWNGKSRNKDLHDFSQAVLGPNSILAFVPGAVDVAHAEQGIQGWKYIASNPLTSVLDVVPYSRLTGGVISRLGSESAVASIAAKAGVHADELKGMGGAQLAWKMAMNAKVPAKLGGHKVFGNVPNPAAESGFHETFHDQTVGDLKNSLLEHIGAAGSQADLNKAIREEEQVGQTEKIALLEPFNKAWNKLNKEATLGVVGYLSSEYRITDFRPDWEITDDPRFSIDQREAIKHTIELNRKVTDIYMNSGKLKMIRTATGGFEAYMMGPGTRGNKVLSASTAADKAVERLHTAAWKMNKLMQQTRFVDDLMIQYLDQVDKFRVNVWNRIKTSIPDLMLKGDDNEAYRNLVNALPKEDRPDYKPGVTGRNRVPIPPGAKKNLQDFLGLDQKIESRVYRGGGKEAIPFDGPMTAWSQAERTAYDEAKKSAERLPPDAPKPSRTSIMKLAEKRLRITSVVHDVPIHAPVPPGVAKILYEVSGPGQIVDQAKAAFDSQEWDKLLALATAARDKLNNKSFQSPTRSADLAQLVDMVTKLQQYAKTRADATERIRGMWEGKSKKGTNVERGSKLRTARKNSVAVLARQATDAVEAFKEASIKYPPVPWDIFKRLEYQRLLHEREEGVKNAQDVVSHMRAAGVSETDLGTLHDNPNVIGELAQVSARVSVENDMLPNIEPGLADQISREAAEQAFDTRKKAIAAGVDPPLYLATLHPGDRLEGTAAELYNVTIGKTSISREQATFDKNQDMAQATIFDYQAAMNKTVHEMVVRDHEIHFQTEQMPAHLHSLSFVESIIRKYFIPEMKEAGVIPPEPGGIRTADYSAFVEKKLSDWGFVSYNPEKIFSTSIAKVATGDQMLIHKDILHGLEMSWERLKFPGSKFYDRATGTFRTSILGYSPRFTAHIIVGGTVLAAAKSSPQIVKHLGDAWHITRALTAGKEFPAEIAAKWNLGQEDITMGKVFPHNSTQEGFADVLLQHAMGASASQYHIQELIAQMFGKEAADFKHPDFITHYLKVIPEHQYKLTRFATNMQRSSVLLDGLRAASRDEHFYMDEWDEEAQAVKRAKYDMTPQQAFHQAMIHAEHVMGDVRRMTPIEYNILTRIFPFWSWTRHVLSYVLKYPGDHPYRAMYLSQVSRINAENTNPALPLRSQLLFFLGNPDPSGNVTAIDSRAANPLRDTAQYMTLAGWLSAANPLLTSVPNMVDPNLTFGTNVLYPTMSYNALYGTTEAGPAGSWLTPIEGIIPQTAAVDQALNLSGQFSYLKGQNRSAYIKKVFDTLGVSWIPQHLNLRQIAATNELDRYNQARAAAQDAWKSGDFSALKGYRAVPDPRNTEYDITPQQLEQVYAQTAGALGVGIKPGEVAAVTPRLQSPKF